jgi:hypothetical protein
LHCANALTAIINAWFKSVPGAQWPWLSRPRLSPPPHENLLDLIAIHRTGAG